MISIIVSSYQEAFFKQFEENVNKTIGVTYEIVRIYNPHLMSICEAYNKGARQAKYPYICFVHEDLCFNTTNWGSKIIADFESDAEIGLIGVAGSAYKAWVTSGWGALQHKYISINILQKDIKSTAPPTLTHINENNTKLVQNIALDGCFLFTSQTVYKKYQFDSRTFTHYHCYDIDYSLQVRQTYKVVVTFNVLLTHFSVGGFEKKWLSETQKLHKKWKGKFPIVLGEATTADFSIEEEYAFLIFLRRVIQMKTGYGSLLNQLLSPRFIQLLGFQRWSKMLITGMKIVKMELNDTKNRKVAQSTVA